MLEPLSGRERFRLPEPIGEVESFYCIHSKVLTLPKSIAGVQRVAYQVSFPAAVMNMKDVLLDLRLLDAEPFSIDGSAKAENGYYLTRPKRAGAARHTSFRCTTG